MVYVFTPKGEVIEMPAGSVPIDFAYRIHTEIGNRTVGARVNGRVVQLNHRLSTGDIVEIQTTKHPYGPSQDWVSIAKSSHARSKIRQWFKRSKRAEHIGKGRQALERELKRQAYDFAQVASDEQLLEAARKFNFNEIEDLFVAIAVNGIGAQQVATKLTEKIRRQEELDRYELKPELRELRASTTKKPKNSQGVRVVGVDNLLVRFAGCCKPVPGDDIVGFVTRGRGVSVHRSNCTNIPAVISDEQERIIEVQWEQEVESNFTVQIEVIGHERRGLLNDVLQAVSENKTYMSAISGRADKNKTAIIQMTIMIRNTEQLNKVMDRIQRVKDVYNVSRIMQ
jgi:GTP pyrophosphokinase